MKTIVLSSLVSLSLSAQAADAPALKLFQSVPLSGVKGRFDHFALDAKGGRLFVAALGNNTLEVLDVAAGKHLKSITGLHKPTGVVFLPELNQIGVANGDDGMFKLFDGASYEPLNNLPSLDDADNVRRDAKTKLIYVGYGDGALAILDSAGRKKLGEVKLPAHPESFQLESDAPRIFVNVPDAKQITVIDREKKSVVATWPMEKYQANFPMTLDEANHRLFIGCRRPARLVVFDTETGKPVSNLEISGDTDDLFYDAQHKRIYTSCGEGFIDVIGQTDRDHYETLGRIPARAGARTSFFSAEMSRFYLAVPQRRNQPAEIRAFDVQP